MTVQHTQHELAAEPQLTSTSRHSDYQKQMWEREFWRQQRNIDVAGDSNEPTVLAENHNSSGQLPVEQNPFVYSGALSAGDTGGLYGPVSSVPIAADSTRNSSAELSTNRQANQVVGASMYLQPVDEKSPLSVKSSTASSANAERSFAKGMLQVYEDNACIWLGDQTLKNDRSFMKQLKEAVNFFGLKLKRLVINGTEMEVVQMKQDLTNTKESDYGS